MLIATYRLLDCAAIVPLTEAEILAARLARVRTIIESLEAECSQSAAAQAKFDKLKSEMDEIRRCLTIVVSIPSRCSALAARSFALAAKLRVATTKRRL